MQGSSYTDELRRHAVVAYQVHGNLNEVAREFGIPCTTLKDWKNSEWWTHYTAEIRQDLKDEVTADITRTYRKYIAALEDRVDNGDAVVTKAGIVRVPVRARDLGFGASVLFGQRQLLLNQPTSIREGNGLTDIASTLVQAFQTIVDQNRAGTAERVVETIEAATEGLEP